jgi:ABC-type Fe3+-siderophore transport system permease subunit
MENPLSMGKTFINCLISGVTTGMGNGSVFGAALMCALGRGRFEYWGGIYGDAYNPVTFQGFVDWCMLLFGFAFTAIMLILLRRHGELEAATIAEQKSSHA